MIVTSSFTKLAPVSDSTVFELIGVPPSGLAVALSNLDGAATLVYKFQGSDDGSTWEDIEFTLSGGGTATQFSLLAGGTPHLIKVPSGTQRIRLVAHGDLDIEVGVLYPKAHNSAATPPQVSLLY